MSGAVNMSSWTWVAKTLKNLRLATPASSSIHPNVTATGSNNGNGSNGGLSFQQSRLMSATAAPGGVTVPPKPKKPLTPYFRFLGQVRNDVTKANPNLKVTEVMKKVAVQWDKLDEGGKGRYIAAYKKEMEGYAQTLDKYNQSLSPEQAALGEQLKMEKAMKKEKREKRRRVKELGKPKKPMSGFLLFLRSQVKPGEKSITEFHRMAKELGAKWKGMSEAEKAPYTAQYQEGKAQYEKDMKKWEDKMLKQGNDDLVRIGHLTKMISKSKAHR